MSETTVSDNIIQEDSAREGLSLNKAVSFELQNVEVKDSGSVWMRYKVRQKDGEDV